MERGELTSVDGRSAVRFTRIYPYPVERVWAAVSDPQELPGWFPSAVAYDEERAGSAISFTGDPYAETAGGTVLVFDPPHRFGFTWGDDEVYLTVRETSGGGSELTLVDVLAAEDAAARNAAGWTVCLTELRRLLAGETPTGPHREGAEPFLPLYEAYVAEGMPSGAHIPE
ncbi:SRPBCC domain-containing protein [Streptomyces sp. NPDC059740]|uniref:SRPBCC domain-containing protein n=1 Tax=Streptomyces sp. NPDC059740 TaxID=3346926 RepID=UPI003657E23E